MRKIIFIVLLFGCTSSYAGFLFKLKQVSLFYGETYYSQGPRFHTFEFQYDNHKSGCHGAMPYYGIGLVYGFNQNQEIIGVKGMWAPRRTRLHLTSKMMILPYFFAQGNLVKTDKEFTNKQNHIISGIGFNGVYRLSDNISIRPLFQLGYNFNNEFSPSGNRWVIEAKLGVGFNTRLFKRKKKEK